MADGSDKILIVAPGGACARGGMGRMVGHLVRRFAADGELRVATLDTYGRRVNERHAILSMPFHFAAAVARLAAACAARRVALAHVHMAGFGSVYRKSAAMLVCRLFHVPVILHIHGGDLDRFHARLGPLRRWALRRTASGAAEILVLGEYWRNFVVAHLGVPGARVTILYNGVPRPEARPYRAIRSRCELLFLGMVWPQKGMDELLAALALPVLVRLSWHMTIAGIGKIAEYRARAWALGIADRVDFVGWTDETVTQGLLEHADILVLPSHFECLPMAVIEAMAYGLAVIATPVGSVREAVDDEVSGLLVPVGDSQRLAEAMKRLIESPSLRRQLGAKAYERFCQTFDLDIFERRMREIYRKHMAVRRHPSMPIRSKPCRKTSG